MTALVMVIRVAAAVSVVTGQRVIRAGDESLPQDVACVFTHDFFDLDSVE
jgi:hypothetical protein